MRATCISWDAPDDVKASLPSEIQIPAGIQPDEIGDYLSDRTGWCHYGYALEPDAHILQAQCGMPFLPEGARWELYYLSSPADLADACMALYGCAGVPHIENMRGAAYPCWAVFSEDGSGGGRCEGPLDQVCLRWDRFVDEAVKSADAQMQRFGMGGGAVYLRPARRAADDGKSCAGCAAIGGDMPARCAVCRRRTIASAEATDRSQDMYWPAGN